MGTVGADSKKRERESEKLLKHGMLFFYMITAVRLLYTQKWKVWGIVGEDNRACRGG